jgi:predicted nucleic acid-binding protein
LTTVVVDACFLITLEEAGKLQLLKKAKLELGWRIVVPDAVYKESTRKEAAQVEGLLIDSILEHVTSIKETADRLARRYPMLGKGEIEAMAFVLTEGIEECMIISDDQRATKAFRAQGLAHLSTLSFLSKMCHLSMISREELLRAVPLLKESMWISQSAIESFIASL